MKNYLKIILFVIIVSGFNNHSFANPLSNIMSIFQKDLVIEVSYNNHRNLIQGSEVYLAEEPKGEKVLIGQVKKVSLVESQMSKVELVIEKKYKKKIYETTPFVLMSNIFSKNSNAYIVAVSSLEPTDKTPLKSGSLVKGVTFLEYKIARAGEELKKVMGSIKNQNKELVSQLEKYIDTFNTDAFHKKIDELANQVSKFSAEQKKTFKKEVLPSLKKMFESIKEQLEEQNNKEKSKDLERQLQKIEDMVVV